MAASPGRVGDPCTVPDNGTGTITLPPAGCDYLSPDEVHEIIIGLPAGTTIELDAIHKDFICRQDPAGSCSVPLPPGVCEGRGGSLGGHGDCFESTLELQVDGTGALAGFNTTLVVPISCEIHTGPRNPGDPVQTFDTDMYRLEGELFGDPDFCTFKVTGGSDNGLPSPGQTTLTRLPSGDFNVDSFFDITYQIEFAGCDGSRLADYAGTTTATIRMETGTGSAPPSCAGICPAGTVCEQTLNEKADGTIDVCCDCVTEPPPCGPTADGQSCEDVTCPIITDTCVPTVVRQSVPSPFFPPAGVDNFTGTTGQIQITDVDGNTDTYVITGEAPNLTQVLRQDAADAGGFHTLDTEIVALELVGENPAGQQVLVHLSPVPSSVGKIKGAPDTATDFPADSFFDVFVTIDIPDLAGATGLSHAEPITLEATRIADVPPWGSSFETPAGWDGVDLLNASGEPTGLKIVQVSHQLPPPPPEWHVIECDCLPDGACHVAFGPGGAAPVWCDGSCPVGYVCKLIGTDSNNDGNDDTFECRCVPEPCPKFANVVWSKPEHLHSLWRIRNNVMRFGFDNDITVPEPGQIEIVECLPNCQEGPDISGYFDISVSVDAVKPVLRLWQGPTTVFPILKHRSWYKVRNVSWPCVNPFQFQYVVQMGDADDNNFVTNSDVLLVNNNIGPTFGVDDSRFDIDGNLFVTNSDVLFANLNISGFVPKLCCD